MQYSQQIVWTPTQRVLECIQYSLGLRGDVESDYHKVRFLVNDWDGCIARASGNVDVVLNKLSNHPFEKGGYRHWEFEGQIPDEGYTVSGWCSTHDRDGWLNLGADDNVDRSPHDDVDLRPIVEAAERFLDTCWRKVGKERYDPNVYWVTSLDATFPSSIASGYDGEGAGEEPCVLLSPSEGGEFIMFSGLVAFTLMKAGQPAGVRDYYPQMPADL